uniref:EF-hand domain-containing protein n=1 Tax=Macrostomum lignano TaxID=282301 RepID=A0A1I8IVR0_9PLAT
TDASLGAAPPAARLELLPYAPTRNPPERPGCEMCASRSGGRLPECLRRKNEYELAKYPAGEYPPGEYPAGKYPGWQISSWRISAGEYPAGKIGSSWLSRQISSWRNPWQISSWLNIQLANIHPNMPAGKYPNIQAGEYIQLAWRQYPAGKYPGYPGKYPAGNISDGNIQLANIQVAIIKYQAGKYSLEDQWQNIQQARIAIFNNSEIYQQLRSLNRIGSQNSGLNECWLQSSLARSEGPAALSRPGRIYLTEHDQPVAADRAAPARLRRSSAASLRARVMCLTVTARRPRTILAMCAAGFAAAVVSISQLARWPVPPHPGGWAEQLSSARPPSFWAWAASAASLVVGLVRLSAGQRAAQQDSQADVRQLPAGIVELGTVGGGTDSEKNVEPTEREKLMEAAACKAFSILMGDRPGFVVDDLMEILNMAFTKSGPSGFTGFSKEACRSLLAFVDVDQSGYLQFDEFKALWKCLRLWSVVFKAFDADSSGDFNSFELRAALGCMGYRVPNKIYQSLVMRYAGKSGSIKFDDFPPPLRLTKMSGTGVKLEPPSAGAVQLTAEHLAAMQKYRQAVADACFLFCDSDGDAEQSLERLFSLTPEVLGAADCSGRAPVGAAVAARSWTAASRLLAMAEAAQNLRGIGCRAPDTGEDALALAINAEQPADEAVLRRLLRQRLLHCGCRCCCRCARHGDASSARDCCRLGVDRRGRNTLHLAAAAAAAGRPRVFSVVLEELEATLELLEQRAPPGGARAVAGASGCRQVHMQAMWPH